MGFLKRILGRLWYNVPSTYTGGFMIKSMYAFGDSHVTNFGRGRGIIPVFCGDSSVRDVLAWSEGEPSSIDEIFTREVLDKIPKDTHLVVMLGNTDCRELISVELSDIQELNSIALSYNVALENKCKDMVIAPYVENHMKFISHLRDLGFENLIVVGPFATNCENVIGDKTVTIQELNSIALSYNVALENKCKDAGIIFVSMFLNMVYNDFSSDARYYEKDGIHVTPDWQMKFFVEQLVYAHIFMEPKQ